MGVHHGKSVVAIIIPVISKIAGRNTLKEGWGVKYIFAVFDCIIKFDLLGNLQYQKLILEFQQLTTPSPSPHEQSQKLNFDELHCM